MPEAVLSPLSGTVVPLADVPDPVFAQQIVGGGLAVQPPHGAGPLVASAPVSGTLVRVQPHAFVIQSTSGTGILVHIGIDTVRMDGAGFQVLATEGAPVRAGDPVVQFDPRVIAEHGYSDICPVIVLQSPPGAVPSPATPRAVKAADVLFTWPA
jgi:PTS system glucose-specific IIA component